MKVAIQNPAFIFASPEANFNGYNLSFLRSYAHFIYLTHPWQYVRYQKRLKELGIALPCLFTIRSLKHYADVLLHFGGEPDISGHRPPKNFHGLKIWHVLDYVFRADSAAQALKEGGVDYVMGYARHDLFCDFFKVHYKDYLGKVIAVPFGYAARFHSYMPHTERDRRCIALGAVNPIDDPLCKPSVLDAYIAFHREKKWTHALRRQIAVCHQELAPLVVSKLPLFPETKNASYDAVKELNAHQFFVNDEGVMNFPPARTYEGMAAGAIMLASNSPIWQELGCIDGQNYIAFKQNDLADFCDKLTFYRQQPHLLVAMQQKSLHLAKRYTHGAVATRLHQSIAEIIAGL